MAKSNTLFTPWGRAVYPHLQAEDPAYGGFIFKIIPESEEELKVFQAKLLDIVGPVRFKTKTPTFPYPELQDGTVMIKAKSKYRPLGFDSKNRPLPKGLTVGSGSLIRAAVVPNVYDKGISLYLQQYQVKELRDGGGASSQFEEVDDGFEAEELQAEGAFDTEEPAGSALDI